jgi:hypothetical protein
MTKPAYGTIEYYAEQFSDFLADVQADSPKTSDAVVGGFLLAIQEWKEYHQAQVNEYTRIDERVRQTLTV